MKQQFIHKNFRAKSLAMIQIANQIIEEYAAQGYSLTLRQLYYQFIARDTFPEDRRWRWAETRWVKDANGTKNAQPNYKWLGSFINDARLAGYIDWDSIEDRTRNVSEAPFWDSPADVIEAARHSYQIDMWSDQPRRVEVWIEKEALTGVIHATCRKLHVPYFACRGYVSQSETYAAYQRACEHPLTILHLGDHDPSGIDMTRDNLDRLTDVMGGDVDLVRIALNMDQVEELNPPPSPAKVTDSRWRDYMLEFGNDSWELDALEPSVINELIKNEVAKLRDDDLFNDAQARYEMDCDTLDEIVNDLT